MGEQIPREDQIREWEAVARGKIQVLLVLAEVAASGETVSSGWLRQKCGLSADEWHDSGELLASLLCFAADNDFMEWHARTMMEYDGPDEVDYNAPNEAERLEMAERTRRLK